MNTAPTFKFDVNQMVYWPSRYESFMSISAGKIRSIIINKDEINYELISLTEGRNTTRPEQEIFDTPEEVSDYIINRTKKEATRKVQVVKDLVRNYQETET